MEPPAATRPAPGPAPVAPEPTAPGYHMFRIGGTAFEIEERYNLIRPIGHGAYGVVISAQDTRSGGLVAIKKIQNAFQDHVMTKRLLREIRLLRLARHDHIISVLNLPPPPPARPFEDIYIVTDLMETDLHRIIYSNQALGIDHVQYFLYQILRALKYLHSANVIHRDLKPSNILVNSNCDLKLCDFGLARGFNPDEQDLELTEYVVTRWYRAPEVMLATQEYSAAIDVWSVGCIFAELLQRQPMFQGDDYLHQLRLIVDRLGRPTAGDIAFVRSDRARRFIELLPPPQRGPRPGETPIDHMSRLLPQATNEALELILGMLCFDPGRRITVQEALEHRFMAGLHDGEEPTADFTFEEADSGRGDRNDLRDLVWNQIRAMHPGLPPKYPLTEQELATPAPGAPGPEAAAPAPAANPAAAPTGVEAAQRHVLRMVATRAAAAARATAAEETLPPGHDQRAAGATEAPSSPAAETVAEARNRATGTPGFLAAGPSDTGTPMSLEGTPQHQPGDGEMGAKPMGLVEEAPGEEAAAKSAAVALAPQPDRKTVTPAKRGMRERDEDDAIGAARARCRMKG